MFSAQPLTHLSPVDGKAVFMLSVNTGEEKVKYGGTYMIINIHTYKSYS